MSQNCSSATYLIKCDDDTWVNLRHIAYIIKTRPEMVTGFFCSVYQGLHTIRNGDSKWYVSYEEYDGYLYPDYCEGFGYVLPTHWLDHLVEQAHKEPYFWVDDVFVTGILAEKVGVQRSNQRMFLGEGFKKHVYCNLAEEFIAGRLEGQYCNSKKPRFCLQAFLLQTSFKRVCIKIKAKLV